MSRNDDVIFTTVDIFIVFVLPFDVDLNLGVRSAVAEVLARRPGLEDYVNGLSVCVCLGCHFYWSGGRLEQGKLFSASAILESCRRSQRRNAHFRPDRIVTSRKSRDRVNGEIILVASKTSPTVQRMKKGKGIDLRLESAEYIAI